MFRLSLHFRSQITPRLPSKSGIRLRHGGLLSLNAWKLSPTPRKIDEPDNRCQLCTRYIKHYQHLKAILAPLNYIVSKNHVAWYCKLSALVLQTYRLTHGDHRLHVFKKRQRRSVTEMEHAKAITVKLVVCTVVFWYRLVATHFLK